MDNKIALERMKQLLCDISTKNESLNKDNNDLNLKVLSLVKLLKVKDNQLENNRKSLIKHILKNIFYKKYIKEQQILRKYLSIFKNCIKININTNIKNNPFKSLLFYTHENDLYFRPSKKFNYNDIGIGDFKINYRYYIRKVACLTLLKRRKYYANNDEKNNINNNGQNNDYKINLIFKNILPQNEVINMCIKSNRNNNKKENYDFSVFQLNIIRNNKYKKLKKKILKSENIYNDYSILSTRKSDSNFILKEKYEKEINNYNENIKTIEIDNNNLKLDINKKEKEINNLIKKCKDNELQIKINIQEKNELQKEIINIKKENMNYKKNLDNYSIIQKKLNEYENKYNKLNNFLKRKKLEIKIDNINKYNLEINSTRISKDDNKITITKIIKTNDIIIFGDKPKRSNSFSDIFLCNQSHFKILSKRKKNNILKKFNFNLNIINDNENSYFNDNFKCNKFKFIISKENNINIYNKQKNPKIKEVEYDVIEPLKYEIDENKNNFDYNKGYAGNNIFEVLELSNSVSFNYIAESNYNKNIKNNFGLLIISKSSSLNIIENDSKKDEIINKFNLSLSEIDKKNNYFKLIIFNLKIKLLFGYKRKFLFFINFHSLYHQNKITKSYKMFRSLLINLKMKSIFKNILNCTQKYFFFKYYFIKYNSISINTSLLITKKELQKNIESNNKLNSQINIFQETFKKYEESNTREKNEKDNIINKQKNIINTLKEELSQKYTQFEKMKKTAKDSAAELISSSNDNNKQRKIIQKLNEELKELQNNKIIYENQIKNQQEVIKNLNEKIKKDQSEYEQNEQDVSNQIEKLKNQFNEYENSIEKLNLENINLKKENEKLKFNNENLNSNKEELMILIENNKNYEKENNILKNENKELKINNEEINMKYNNLKILSEEIKSQLSKAMKEMDEYSEILQASELRIKEAENQKINAENERDKAINDVREIRQRYINIMGEKYA